jgi:hypothetical protein
LARKKISVLGWRKEESLCMRERSSTEDAFWPPDTLKLVRTLQPSFKLSSFIFTFIYYFVCNEGQALGSVPVLHISNRENCKRHKRQVYSAACTRWLFEVACSCRCEAKAYGHRYTAPLSRVTCVGSLAPYLRSSVSFWTDHVLCLHGIPTFLRSVAFFCSLNTPAFVCICQWRALVNTVMNLRVP